VAGSSDRPDVVGAGVPGGGIGQLEHLGDAPRVVGVLVGQDDMSHGIPAKPDLAEARFDIWGAAGNAGIDNRRLTLACQDVGRDKTERDLTPLEIGRRAGRGCGFWDSRTRRWRRRSSRVCAGGRAATGGDIAASTRVGAGHQTQHQNRHSTLAQIGQEKPAARGTAHDHLARRRRFQGNCNRPAQGWQLPPRYSPTLGWRRKTRRPERRLVPS
jgi:hypothetical protein